MKIFVGLIILFIMFGSFVVEAGDKLELDFTENHQQIVGLKRGDMAEFYLNGERNVIIIDKIKSNSVDITAFIAQETNGYPYYTTLSRDKTLKIDVERDDIDDLYIGYYKSDEDLKYVYLIMERPENKNTPTGSVIGRIIREKREYDRYVIAGFIFIIGLLSFLLFKYRNKKEHS